MSLGDSRRWLTLTLGKQKRKKQLPLRRDTWTVTYSFLVYDLKEDVVRTHALTHTQAHTFLVLDSTSNQAYNIECTSCSSVCWVQLLLISLSLSPPPPPSPQLVTKVKLYRVVNSQVLATHSIALDSLHLLDQRGAAILAVRYDNLHFSSESSSVSNTDLI